MSESQMVERVGEALRDECLEIFGSTWSYPVAWRLARAAIAAMHGPTDKMICGALDDWDKRRAQSYTDTWNAMIDGALK